MKMKTAAIIQARMGSSRLPGKVLEKIAGKPLLWHLVHRLKKAELLNALIIATTDREADRPILVLANNLGIESYAGNETDVLDRFYQAATRFNINVICRITADCPLIDPQIVDKTIQVFFKADCDYVSNGRPASYPDGLDVEVFSYSTLEQVWQKAKLASEREHVTPYIHNHPDKFHIVNVVNDIDLSHMRWTVDNKEDLELVREIYKHLYIEGSTFYMRDVLELFTRYPHLKQINQGINRNEGYAKSLLEDSLIK
jgi:spore coat polysaccharide biosynthesis protein SpsF